MPVVTHPFVSAIADDPAAVAAGEVVPSNWNANHTLAYNISTSTTGSSVTMDASEDIREVNRAHAFTVNLPTSPIAGKPYRVVDTSGAAATYNITISPASYVIGSNNGAWTGYYSTSASAWIQTA